MSDLITMLRWYADQHDGHYEPTPNGEGCVAHTLREASAEIQRLRRERDSLELELTQKEPEHAIVIKALKEFIDKPKTLWTRRAIVRKLEDLR